MISWQYFKQAIAAQIGELKWENAFAAIVRDSRRQWKPLPRFLWPDEATARQCQSGLDISQYYRVHRHPDPFRSHWTRYQLPKGWAHAGLDPANLIRVHGSGTNGFLTEFSPRRNDLWCGDFGIEHEQFRCCHQFPRPANFASQVPIITQYIRGYGDLRQSEFFHETAVSWQTHPPTRRFIYRDAHGGIEVTQLSQEEIVDFVRWGGLRKSVVTELSRPDFADNSPIDPKNHRSQSNQPYIGGHPVEVFFAYLLLGFRTKNALATWTASWDGKAGFKAAIEALKDGGAPNAANARMPYNSQWFQTSEHFTAGLVRHGVRMSKIHENSSARLFEAMTFACKDLLQDSSSSDYLEKTPNYLSDLEWRVDDYATEGKIPSGCMPRHKW